MSSSANHLQPLLGHTPRNLRPFGLLFGACTLLTAALLKCSVHYTVKIQQSINILHPIMAPARFNHQFRHFPSESLSVRLMEVRVMVFNCSQLALIASCFIYGQSHIQPGVIAIVAVAFFYNLGSHRSLKMVISWLPFHSHIVDRVENRPFKESLFLWL